MKKIIALAAVAAVAFFVIRRTRSAKTEDVWREATVPADK